MYTSNTIALLYINYTSINKNRIKQKQTMGSKTLCCLKSHGNKRSSDSCMQKWCVTQKEVYMSKLKLFGLYNRHPLVITKDKLRFIFSLTKYPDFF